MAFGGKVELKFRCAWITAGHSTLWNCNSTYCEVPCEYLPQVVKAKDDLAWLDSNSDDLTRIISGRSSIRSGDNRLANLEAVVAKAQSLGFELPDPFLRFMRDPVLQDKVPSCTACFLELSDDFVPVPDSDGSFFMRFITDSQSCVMWYLWLQRNGKIVVVASYYYLEPDIFEAMEYEEGTYRDCFDRAVICAESFTEFLYRFWVENSIWYSLHKKLPFTALQEDYWSRIVKKPF
jgi:hypothetical protein